MQPKKQITSPQLELFRNRLENIFNRRHELYRLSGLIGWEMFEQEFGKLYAEEGRPGPPIRLMVSLTYLGHAYQLSDEEVVRRWVKNPYCQYFCGEEYFRHELPIDPSSLNRWRRRIGVQRAELILKLTVPAGLHTKTVQPSSLERGIFDTIVQEKAVAFPTDSRLYNRSRVRLVTLALQYGVDLRQTYSWVFRQRKRAGREIKRLKTFLGRVYRDIQRKIEGRLELKSIFLPELVLAERLLTQERQDKDKLYSLHAPEVECIFKNRIRPQEQQMDIWSRDQR